MAATQKIALGIDFGTESVRALLVDLNGRERASAVVPLSARADRRRAAHGAEEKAAAALRAAASDRLDRQFRAGRQASGQRRRRRRASSHRHRRRFHQLHDAAGAGRRHAALPADRKFEKRPLAWPKLWKHHGAVSQTERINAVARERNEPLLEALRRHHRPGMVLSQRCSKRSRTIPRVYDAAEVWLEAGDWFVWQLVGGDAAELPRSTCQAGYKGMWTADDGYPSASFLHGRASAARRQVVEREDAGPTRCARPAGRRIVPQPWRRSSACGRACPSAPPIIDAHAGVPGAGAAEPGALVMVMGTSSCHMLNADGRPLRAGRGRRRGRRHPARLLRLRNGPGRRGRRLRLAPPHAGPHEARSARPRKRPRFRPAPTASAALDWLNGCRTPLMDGSAPRRVRRA